ncbi:hypothetical protein Y032_0235g3177 [Ancylostoma ceylanicum]|nr:hypothetical protein Y032_0235g3177 [Ancylostoma ceylanicum]
MRLSTSASVQVKHHVLVDQGFRRTVRFIRPYGNLEAMRDKEKAYFNRKLSSGGYHNGEVAIFLDSHFCSGRQKPDRGFRTQIASKFFVKCNRRILKSVTTASYLLARPKMMIWLTKLHPQAKLHPHQEKKLRRMIPRNKGGVAGRLRCVRAAAVGGSATKRGRVRLAVAWFVSPHFRNFSYSSILLFLQHSYHLAECCFS